jgi:YHS domain-containing protein
MSKGLPVMFRLSVGLAVTLGTLSLFTGATLRGGQNDDAPSARIPSEFKALEYLAGGWKGQGVPKNDPANSFHGWPETHSWSWVFRDGSPIALSVKVEGGRVLSSGILTYDPARKLYRLEGLLPPPAGGAIRLEGTLDRTGKQLTLESIGKLTRFAGTVRLAIRPNANFVRYTIREDRKEAGGIQFRPFIELGLTKEGESFASGATAAERAKCIITGAASTMSVTYQGTSYPVCCTGCRDEFQENPEKYIKKASQMQKEAGTAKPVKTATTRVARSEDAFAGDVTERDEKSEPPADPKPAAGAAAKASASKAPTATAKDARSTASGGKNPPGTSASKGAAKATSLLQIGQNLEKNGSRAAALSSYRRIVKDYPDTPAAKTARERIKVIEAHSD